MNKGILMKKYSVRQSIMYDLKKWKEEQRIDVDNDAAVSWEDFKNLPDRVINWQLNTGDAIESNNRLIAIIKWLNGEDVFEVEKQNEFCTRNTYREFWIDNRWVLVEVDE